MRFSAVTVTIAILAIAGCATFTSAPAKTFIVFFARDSDNLMPDSKASVRQAAEAIKLLHPSVVMVAGEPKTVAAPRFEAVEAELMADGIDQKLLSRASLTDLEARVGPADSRRVEIRLFTK